MIEPVTQGAELIAEIANARPGFGSLFVWWLGQSGFVITSRTGLLAIDLYLSEHLTTKYASTNRPHIRMARAPLRGHELRGLGLVLASHKHSDHLVPGTIPELLAASAVAILALPRMTFAAPDDSMFRDRPRRFHALRRPPIRRCTCSRRS